MDEPGNKHIHIAYVFEDSGLLLNSTYFTGCGQHAAFCSKVTWRHLQQVEYKRRISKLAKKAGSAAALNLDTL